MTDEQIIKALECCATDDGDDCFQCPYCNLFYEPGNGGCVNRCRKDALELINRQKAEIESLKQIIDEQDKEIIKLQKRIIFWREDLNYQPEKIKSEAIKEFAERLKEEMRLDDDCDYDCINCHYECKEYIPYIDNLVKEMTKGE